MDVRSLLANKARLVKPSDKVVEILHLQLLFLMIIDGWRSNEACGDSVEGGVDRTDGVREGVHKFGSVGTKVALDFASA